MIQRATQDRHFMTRAELEAGAKALLEPETLTQDELQEIVGSPESSAGD